MAHKYFMAPFRIVVGFVVLLRHFTSACDAYQTIATCPNICIDISAGFHSWEWQYTAKVHRQNLRRLRGYSCRAAAHPRHRTSKPSRATGPLGLTPCVECAPETDRAVSRSRAHFCLLDYLKAPSTSPPPGWQQPAPWLTEAGEPESETLAVHRRQDRRAG